MNAPAAHLALLLLLGLSGRADARDTLVLPEHRVAPEAPAWRDLIDAFADNADITADFTERRFYSFKKAPIELHGEVRLSATRGLSLHYTTPEDHIVILDTQGMILRTATGESVPPADPRATAANEALLRILRFDFPALSDDFALYGQRDGPVWTLALVPRTDTARRSVNRITVTGEATSIRHIEIRRTSKQRIEIIIEPPRTPAVFTADALKQFFR